MKTTLVLATTTTALAAGVAFGFYRFSTTGQPDVDTALPTVEYDLPAGPCATNCQAFAADGSPLAFTSVSYTVPADATPPAPPAPAPSPEATYEAPTGLTVTFG